MKVIRLLEAASPTVDDIKHDFANLGLKVSEADAREHLKQFFERMKHYGKNNTRNVNNLLFKFDIKFIKYFLDCLGYDRLSDRSNLILTALSNPAASQLINGQKAIFTKIFNLTNNSEDLGLNIEYLSDPEALIFNKSLYTATKDNDIIEGIIINDVKNMGDKTWRKGVKAGLERGEFAQFASKETSTDRKKAAITKQFNELSKKDQQAQLKALNLKDTTVQQAMKDRNEAQNNQ